MKKLLKLRKEVSHGGIIPRGWKLAWYEPRRRIGVYCPAPLHWIFRAARECTRRVRLAVRAPTIECAEVFEMQRRHRDREHLAAEYARGYFHGWHECFHVCLETVEDEVTRGNNLWDIGDLLSGTPPKQPRKNSRSDKDRHPERSRAPFSFARFVRGARWSEGSLLDCKRCRG